MDFHTLSRKDLQALCKKNRIPANITNVAMADALQALQMVEGIEELQEVVKLQSPKTIQKTGSHKPVGPTEDQASPLPRSRRVTSRAPGVLNLVDEEEKKKDVAETPKVPNTRRRPRQKDEGNETVETTRMSSRTSAVQGVETQKEEKLVGLTTGRRTRGTLKKEVDLMSGGVRRSSRARGITTMASLAKEDVEEEKVKTGEEVVETTEEKVDKAEEQEEKIDDKAKKVDEADDKAEEPEKVDNKADEVEEEKVETGEVVVATNEEKVDDKAEEQEEEQVDDKAEKVDEVDDNAEEQEKVEVKAEEQEEEKVDDKAKQDEEKGAGDIIVDQQNDLCYEKVAVETKIEGIIDDVAEEKETNGIMEVEIKSLDQTYCHDLTMSEDGVFVDQMSDLQSEEMVVETSKEDQLDDEAEQEEEKLDVQVEQEEHEIDDQADEKLDDNVEQEEEKIDDQTEEKLEDKPEQEEEEQIDDQTEQEEEREMEGIVEEEIKSLEENTCDDLVMAVDEESVDEIKSLEENTCDDLVMAVDEESVDQKNDIEYEEMAAVDATQEEKLDDKPEQEEEQTDDHAEQEEEKEMDDVVDEEIKSLENNTDIIFSHVEEMEDWSELVEEVAIINEDSPFRCLVTSDLTSSNEVQQNPVAEEDENEAATNDESGKETGQIGELIENLSDLNLSFKQEIRDLITSDQTSINEEQQNQVAEEDENVEKSSGKENETATNDESGKETGNIQIGDLIDNLLDLNLSFKEEIKADDGVLREENNNKENSEVVKSKTEKKNYENMSLRKLKASYKEVLLSMNKGEEKRSALKVIDKNCI